MLVFGGAMLIVTNAFALAVPWLLGRVIDALEGTDPAGDITVLALVMIGAALGQAFSRIASRIALFNAARKAEYDLRSELFSHLLTLDGEYFRRHPTGDVMSRLTNDVQTVRALWGPGILNLVNTTFLFVAAAVLMVGIDLELTLWAILPYPSVVILGRVFGRRLYHRSRRVQDQLGELSSSLQEDLTGIGVIKAYTAERQRRGRFRKLSEHLLSANMQLTKVRGQLIPVLGSLASVGTVIVLWVGGKKVINGDIDLGQMVQFSAYLGLLVWPTMALGWMLSLVQRGLASWHRIKDVLAAEPTIVSGPGPDLDLSTARGDLEVRDLTITIDDRTILDGVNLRCPPGTMTALVGRTGSGKSTLVESICRLINIPDNTVFVDGRDVNELPLPTLRRAVGYAPQEAFLFSTTIAENIEVGFPENEQGEGQKNGRAKSRLEWAAAAAGLGRDLSALPDAADTVVGERGITLSGGQRQRVALARAISTEPLILILDDSLSSVDAETERDILARLTEVMRGRTSILISHRVAAVRRADQIAVMDEGRIAEIGTHDELIARGGVYEELYRTQLDSQILGSEDAPSEVTP